MIKYSNSWWGIKKSGEDITAEIMAIVNNADSFIIVCGYNFTFRTSSTSRPFFDALVSKVSTGVKVLLIFPPKLHGRFNPQPPIIHHCLTNRLPIILNHQNHSKWLLTDKELYYGSSNFTKASWKDRVEVLSIHEHTKLSKNWAEETIKDFKIFIDNEITDLTSASRRMKNYRGLLTSTRNAWRSIKPLVQRFNPSIKKAIATLESYDRIISILNEQIVFWFDYYSPEEFNRIFSLSNNIAIAIDELCEYAYCYIYNEAILPDLEFTDDKVIARYNNLFDNVQAVIDSSIEELDSYKFNENQFYSTQLTEINLEQIQSVKELMDKAINE